MQRHNRVAPRTWATTFAAAVVIAATMIAVPSTAGADPGAPWDGTPISQGLGPTYGESWCAPVGTENVPQTPPLADIPYGAVKCTLDQFQVEAQNAGVPHRMDYWIMGQSFGGKDIYAVLVNALETPEQVRDYQRWQQFRALELTDPAGAQALLDSFGEDVKMPVLIEANIHGGERESTDAMMQVLRDLITTPYGVNPAVDEILDHTILIVIPTINPDGRIAGTRQNSAGIDMNRDFLVQSMPEVRAEVALQHEWLPTAGLAMHGYVNPTLVDGLTKPHNPGIEYDIFLKWNQPRLDADEAGLAGIGYGITRPVNQWNSTGGTTPPVGPAYAESWDDWGPFYTQTYMAYLGVDSSTAEMCNSTNPSGGCGGQGRFGSKTAQYLVFYSSLHYWLGHRHDMMSDQAEIFRRGITGAARVPCCSDPGIAARGFDEANHNWMVPYPQAFVIPWGTGQRSNGEANRMAQWLLDNGISLQRVDKDYMWKGPSGKVLIPERSYVVWMNQPFRGLAYTALSVGQDLSNRISVLYAPPGAWSHGQLWGADTMEIPASSTFKAHTVPVMGLNALKGGVASGTAQWYSVSLRGPLQVSAILGALGSGLTGEIAETSYVNAFTGKVVPAGTLIFPNDPATVARLNSVGQAAGIVFDRNQGPKPTTTKLGEVPKVAVLLNGVVPPAPGGTGWDQYDALARIFGSTNAGFVSTVVGAGSVQNSATDPLAGYDVIYNSGAAYPTSVPIAPAPTGATESGTTATITTTASHNLTVGSNVTISGVGVAGYNGPATVTSVVSSTKFTYTSATSGLAPSGGGTVVYSTAQSRLGAFFSGGAGYIATSVSANGFSFLTGSGLVTGTFTQVSDSAGGGIAKWNNVGGAASPISGAYPSQDYLYLPSNVTFFSATPNGAVIDGKYLGSTTDMFVAGLWLDRDPAAANAPMLVHGSTTANGRYVALATNPFSRIDAEREWTLIGQAALWSDLTDES